MKADTTVNVYTQPIEASVKQTLDAIYAEVTAGAEAGGGIGKGKNLVRFGTLGVFDGPQVIDPQRLGA